MASPFDGSSAGLVDNENEDTIELELSAEQVQALSRASAVKEPSPRSAPPDHDSSLNAPPLVLTQGKMLESDASPKPKRELRDRVALALIIVAGLGLLSGIAYLATTPQGPAHVGENLVFGSPLSEAPPLSAADADADADDDEPVRLTNPFDPTEVFEFPPGTSKAEARDAVAELLLQRARERQPFG